MKAASPLQLDDAFSSTGASADVAVYMLQDCEEYLKQRWGFSIGNDCKTFLTAQGCCEPSAQAAAWAHECGDTFTALGHILADDDNPDDKSNSSDDSVPLASGDPSNSNYSESEEEALQPPTNPVS